MKKFILMLSMFLLIFVVVACNKVDKESDDSNAAENEGGDVVYDGFKNEYEQVIADDNVVKIVLSNVEYIVDDYWEEEYVNITFKVENKTEETLEVQTNAVSADGKKIDDIMINLSQEVEPGKVANAILKIQNFEGDLPSIEKNIELNLRVFDWDFKIQKDYPVTIDMTE